MSDRDSSSRRIGADVDSGSSRQSRREDKRQHFSRREEAGRTKRPKLTTSITIAGVLLVFVLVGAFTFANRGVPAAGGAASASGGPVQQVAAGTSLVENGRVSVSVDEVKAKRLVAWDYKNGQTTVPLVAYATPSGAVKVATRMCEPCNSTTFHIEGTQLVCNSCGSRWELENSRGVSGGCQQYPPEVLPGTVVDGKISVDEPKVASWKPRV